ncbi:VCBS repeat-containing protein [candidate division KSB1 bacterium]|nr:VCBS repeat-containing protein [candidate division KSB1 bacterium]
MSRRAWLSLTIVALLLGNALASRRNGPQPAAQQLRPHYRLNHATLRLHEEVTRAAFAAADTISILAIRVEFQRDSLRQTTGDGRFLRTADAKYTIDPPPHNRSYFVAQLTALANYYKTVSRGKAILQFQVYPQAEEQAYVLERNMQYYAPGLKVENSDRRLAELLQDGFKKAEESDQINFSQFDSFVLFHAGVGEDFNEDFDPAPNDIPSAFLNLADLRHELGNNDPNYRGISVQNGAFFIPDGLILPEMQSRELSSGDLVEFGLLGTSALMFGSQLGLPSLFNTQNGTSGIGYFGLMDQGSNNYQGLLPAQPSAWEKVFLGWEEPIVVTQAEDLEIAAALHSNPNKIYKISITDDEYFLIENRARDINNDRIAIGRDVNGVRVEFKESSFLAGSPIGVITSVDEYDFGLPYILETETRAFPGVGILIWHVDETVIRAKYASNEVNADREHRGIDLEEADGAQDIGKLYGFLDPGSGAQLGLAEDAWWKENPVITEFLRPDEEVAFGPNTIPSTASNDGVNTGIIITNFSNIGALMTFSVRNQFSVPNFPQYVSGAANALSPMLADLTGDGKLDIVIATRAGEIFAWRADGSKVITNDDAATITQPNGLQRQVPKALFANSGDAMVTPPVLANLISDNRAEVLSISHDGVLRMWHPRDQNNDGRADLAWQAPLGGASRANIAVRLGANYVFCGTESGKLFSFSNEGAQRWQIELQKPVLGISLYPQGLLIALQDGVALVDDNGQVLSASPSVNFASNLSPKHAFAIADLDNDGVLEALAAENNGRLIFPSTNSVRDFKHELGGMAIGEINRDGRKEIVFASGNELFACNANGVLVENFPLTIGKAKSFRSDYNLAPILADVDGDGAQDVIVAGSEGNVYAFRFDGSHVSGFPLAMAGAGLGSFAIGDFENDGKLELVGVSGNGYVHAWRLPQSSTKADWPMYYHDATQTSYNSVKETPVIVTGDLMPPQSVYNYPNPTENNATRIRYRLNASARVKISIYDVAGDLVTELEGPGAAQTDNEIEWNVSNVQSGVYLARVEAEGESEKAVKMIKIAVVR